MRSILLGGCIALVVIVAGLAVAGDRPARSSGVRPQKVAFVNKYVPHDERLDLDARRAQTEREAYRERDLEVVGQPDLPIEEVEAHNKFSRALKKANYVPPARFELFRHYGEVCNQTIVGWSGEIQKSKQTRQGRVFTVKVWAVFANGGFATTQFATETYLLTRNGIECLDVKPCDTPRVYAHN